MKIKQKFKKAMSFLLSTIMIMMIFFGADFGTLTAYAIGYSIGESDGFSLDSENNVSATFTITEKLGTGTMQGWLLCLFREKPSVNASTGKLTNSGNIHPYSYSNCAYYFFSPDTANATGTHTALWSGTASDEKGSGKTLGEVIKEEDWHIVIGPRYYYTGWGASGIGAGTDGIWENGDYYFGQASEKVGGYDEPQKTTLTITLDRTNYAEGFVNLITYDSKGTTIEDTSTNNATLQLPVGGSIGVLANGAFTVVAEGATISDPIVSGEGYGYRITNITVDTTVYVNKVVAETPSTYSITLDRTNYAEGIVNLITYDSEGTTIEDTSTNNATLQLPVGGSIGVLADGAFTVVAEGATISDPIVSGEGYGYRITNITADTTVYVNKVVAETCTVTIDSTNLAEGALLAAVKFDSDGYDMDEPIELTNGSTVEIPKYGGLLVMSNSSNFIVTVSDTTLANVGDLIVGDAQSGYYISEIKGNITVVVESTTQGGENENPPAGGDGVTGDISSVTITNHIFDDIFADIQDGTLNSYSNEDLYLHAWPKVTVLNKNGEELNTYINNPYIAHRTNSGWEVCDCGNTLNDSEHGILLLFQTEYNHGNDQEDLTSIVSIDSDTLVIDKAWADYSIYPRSGAIYVAIVPGTSGGGENPEPPAHTHSLTLVPEKPATCTEDGYKAYQKCSDESCGKLFKEDGTTAITEVEKIPASHSWVTDAWEKDATNHWHKCSKCTEVKDKAAHVDANADNKCDTCGYVKEVVVTAPAITGQPQNVSVKVDEKATFNVTATGDNLKYQWQINRNDGNGFVNISGATSASYVTSAVDMSCNGFKYQCIVSNEGGNVTSNSATLTVTEKEVVHTHSLTKVPEKAATCTEAGNKAYYTCSGCDSLYADAEGTTVTTLEAVTVKALGHDMTEATCTEEAVCQRTGCVHTEDELGHDWTGEWTIIKEATATEDGKKKTLCTRGCGQKKVVVTPSTGTTEDDVSLEKDAEVEQSAPIDEATLNNSKNDLLDVFTTEEKQEIEDGADARVWIEISDTDGSSISSDVKAEIEEKVSAVMGDEQNIVFFEVDLFKQVGDGIVKEIKEPGVEIEISIKLPTELINTDATITREYKLIRTHEGQNKVEVDIIDGTFDPATGEFTFKTDKFSTYAIVYTDTPVDDKDDNGDTDADDVVKPDSNQKDEVPKTGGSNLAMYSCVLMLISALGIVLSSRKRKTYCKEN